MKGTDHDVPIDSKITSTGPKWASHFGFQAYMSSSLASCRVKQIS